MNSRYRLFLITVASLALSACATTPQHTPAASAPSPIIAPAASASVASLPIAASPAPAPGFWDQLRASFVLSGCEDNADVAHWAARYSAHPRRFDARLQAVLPELRYIAAAVHSQNIPGEFVFLPWVESSYRALPARGKGAGGMWQIMPRTARSLGLRIDQRYDARLDLHVATHAALRLLQRYDDTFHDWRLADMAYNAGMYGILKLLNARTTPLDNRAIPALPVKRVTHNHLAKLIALSCIVRDPQRFDVSLPAVNAADTLVRVNLAAPLNMHVAARLANISLQRLHAMNPAYRDIKVPVQHLILPQGPAQHLSSAYAALGKLQWQRWQRVQIKQKTALAKLIGNDAQRLQVVATINRLGKQSTLARNSRVWLPQTVAASLPADSASVINAAPLSHRVQAGDTLWDLARQFHVHVSELRAWNGLQGSHLRLGQELRLSAPD